MYHYLAYKNNLAAFSWNPLLIFLHSNYESDNYTLFDAANYSFAELSEIKKDMKLKTSSRMIVFLMPFFICKP